MPSEFMVRTGRRVRLLTKLPKLLTVLPSANVTVRRLTASSKVLFPTVSTVFGIVISLRAVQLRNAWKEKRRGGGRT